MIEFARLVFGLVIFGLLSSGVSIGAEPPSVVASVESDDRMVDVDVDDVDLRIWAKQIGLVTGKRFTIDSRVNRRVTITPTTIKVSALYSLFQSILESMGCSVIESDGSYHIALIEDSNGTLPAVIGATEEIPKHGLITKVIRLSHVQASELKKALDPKLAKGGAGSVSAVDITNHLIVTATASTIRRVEKLVKDIDQPGLAQVIEVYPLQHSDASDVALQLTEAMMRQASRGEMLRSRLPNSTGSQARDMAVVAAPQSNSLLLVGTAARIKQVKDVLREIDVEPRKGHGRLHAVFLNHILAKAAAIEIKSLFDQKIGKKAGASQSRFVGIQPSEENNALLVDAAPVDFAEIESLIAQLDIAPKQVWIEVMLVEHTLSDRLNVGVELAALDAPASVGDTVLVGSSRLGPAGGGLMDALTTGLLPQGLTVAASHGARLDADGNVVVSFPGGISISGSKDEGDIKILSKALLPARNNREAQLNFGKNIPLLKSTISGGTGSARDVIQNIEREDVGITFKITPHINPNRDVNLELSFSIEAIIDSGPSGTLFTPTFATRDVTTTVTVPDTQTIVLSGLVREDVTRIVQKVPILGDIPLLGYLFRHTVDGKERVNLLIFVTPHVAETLEETKAIQERWETGTNLRKKDSEESLLIHDAE